MSKKHIFISMIVILLLAACSGAADYAMAPAAEPAMEIAQSSGGGFDDELALKREFEPVEDMDGSVANTAAGETIERMVIKNADLSIVVEDPLKTMDEISAMVNKMSGFVVSSNVWQTTLNNGAKVPHGNINFRVPAERFDEALDTIKAGAGEIMSENVSGQDVTGEYTDLSSQLRNWEAAEEELQEIMDNSRDTEDVIRVYNELARVRENIEIIKGRMNYYEQSAAMSLIKVDITGDEEAQPLQIGGWQPEGTAKDAIETMVEVLQWLGDAAIWIVLCILPIGIIVGIPLFFGGRGLNRIRKSVFPKKDKKAIEKDIAEISKEG
jgi:hypothetical protein